MEDFTLLSDGNYHSNTTHHHHKDHMLAGGSNQTTTSINYNIPTKPDISMAKNDYSMFSNYVQQSALLERAVDPVLDSSCLGGICDLKFSSSPMSNASLNADTHFKNLSIINIEANNTLTKSGSCAVPTIDSSSNDLNATSQSATSAFSSIIFPRSHALGVVGIDPKSIQSCAQTQNYLNMKTNCSDGGMTQEQFLQSSATTATSSCDPDIMSYNISHNNNNNNNRCTNDKTVVQSAVQSSTNNSNNNNRIVANSYLNDTENFRNGPNNEVSSCDLIGSNTNITSIASSGAQSIGSSAEYLITTTSNMAKSGLQSEDVASTSSSSVAIVHSASNSNEVPPSVDALNHNLSMNSSDCDSLSSDELIDLENNGYQDNTSSHSQQSAGGGGGGGGGLGGSGGGPGSNGGGTNASNSSVVLLNGVGQAGSGGGGGGYMSLIPPTVGATSSSGHLSGVSGGTSASSSATGEGIDFKHLFEELCPVCGDKVSGYHYGLLTCESCKGFFKRTVQNKKVYTCVAERSCHIDKTQRKRCPYCRFQKCLEVGMKLEAVRADRMRGGRNKFGPMYKRDRARKLQVMRQRQLALQALRTSIGSADMKSTPLSPGYQQAYPNMNIKQEIQIPQVSSLTQSPDSSPSPIAIALGQVNANSGVISNPLNGNTSSNSNNTSTTSDTINRSSSSSCHDTGTGSMQNTSDSKLCFDSGTHPSSTADSVIEPLRVSPMIREFVQSIDDREWQTQLFALLQKQTYNQVEVDLFELMCKVLDQNLFSQVDWARNTVFFKDLKVDDQMKLLQHSWSDMLVLDHLHQRIHNGLPDETQLNNGQVFNLLGLGLLGVPQLADYFNELQNKLQDLKFDMGDYVCMKFLILLNPDVRGIINKKTVLEGHENVQAALLDYTLTCYPSVTDKFRRLLNILPDIHAMASRGEEHLYSKHCAGSAPTQTLLMEMLHAKRKV